MERMKIIYASTAIELLKLIPADTKLVLTKKEGQLVFSVDSQPLREVYLQMNKSFTLIVNALNFLEKEDTSEIDDDWPL